MDSQGRHAGIMPTSQALAKAREEGLDLVEVTQKASPPVVKIIDFRSFLEEKRRAKQEKREKTKRQEIKEVRFNPFTGVHDFNTRIKKIENFLKEGNKVKVVVRFRGREIAHKEFGVRIIEKVVEYFGNKIFLEVGPKFKGNQLFTFLAPKRK